MNTAIRNIMPEDRLAANATDPTKASWSAVESLFATLIDEVRQLEWMYAQSHSDNPIPRPKPMRRPGVDAKRKLRPMRLEVAQALDPRLRGLSAEEAQEKLRRLISHGN
jgi:hypothetical protein